MTRPSRQQPTQQAPPVQKLQLRYAKRGRARFMSHRDFSRAFERALRRADIPMAFSSGFTPHPRISFANAAPTGAATEAEYVELGLRVSADPEAVRVALNAHLPQGLFVEQVIVAPPGSLAERLSASAWSIRLVGVPRAVMERAVERLLAAERAEVERMTKTGLRTFDARAAIICLEVSAEDTLSLIARHQTPLVRPDDVLSALQRLDEAFAPTEPPLLTRLAQGRWNGTEVAGPFEAAPGA